MNRIPKMLALALAGVVLVGFAGYVSASYVMKPAAIDSGGGHATSESFRMTASVGSPLMLEEAPAASASFKMDLVTADIVQPVVPPASKKSGGCSPSGANLPTASSAIALIGIALSLARHRRVV